MRRDPLDPTLQDQPALRDLLAVVGEFLGNIVDRVPDRDRYHALCCAYLIGVVDRELAHDGARDLAHRIKTFNGGQRALPEAIRALAAEIRSGDCDGRWDETFAIVLEHVIEKVRVSKPEHLDPLHRE
ncbi:MAG: DUF6285 domain-containing protein [Gammaproteobacteria bacterium]